MNRDLNTALARTLVDEWARAGVTDVCLAPGSRSTPLVLALADHPAIRTHVFVDERSAAFFALGTARACGRPAVVVSTSGTAAAEFHPAVLEAHHGRVPLLVCTAYRPAELRDSGAGQTIDQVRLYGVAVRRFVEVSPDPRPGAVAAWRPLAARAVADALGPPAGPVHLNLAFPEPLVPTSADVTVPPGRPGGRPWVTSHPGRRMPDDGTVARVAALVDVAERGLVVAGWGAAADPEVVDAFARAAGWPLLADPLSGLRCGDQAVSTYEALLRHPTFRDTHRPDLVVRLGAPLTSRTATDWLDAGVPQVLVDPDDAWLDPHRAACERVAADPTMLLAAVTAALDARRSGRWLDDWRRAEAVARDAVGRLLDGWSDPFEGRVARDLAAGLPDGTTLFVASSMPVRDLEGFAPPRSDLKLLGNRGVNGIDGFVSTALGVASVSDGPVVALSGDLSFLHDAGGLLGAADRGADVVFVVVDNDGGGIFSFLPQADLGDRFETLFATPHGLDLAAVAAAYGLPACTVESAADLLPTVEKAVGEGGVHVVVVHTDRTDNVARHREVWRAVHDALEAAGLAKVEGNVIGEIRLRDG